MQCSRCRSENEDDAKFCAVCGSSLHKANAPLVCHICSHANSPSANFCVACGAHLRRRSAAAQAMAGTTATTAAAAATEAPAEKPPRFAAYTAEATPPRSAVPPDRPAPAPNAARPDFGGIAGHQENFESAALRPPRVSSFELKAGLAVLVLFVGGGLYWWSTQNDSRLAELAMTARSPAPTVIQPVSDNSSTRSAPPIPDSAKDTSYLAATSAAPVAVPPVATPVPAPSTAVAEAVPKSKSAKHKNARKRRSEPEARQPETVIPEPEPQVAQAAPPPVERHRPSTREQVASCKRMSLFDGERCLWRICDGRWGKDGCPSYN